MNHHRDTAQAEGSTLTPAAAQVEDQLAMSFPGALIWGEGIHPNACFLSVWNVTDFLALVHAETGPKIDPTGPRLYGVAILGNPDYRKGFAQLMVNGQPRFSFDFTDNLAALGRGAAPELAVFDARGTEVARIGLGNLPSADMLQMLRDEVAFAMGIVETGKTVRAHRAITDLALAIREALE